MTKLDHLTIFVRDYRVSKAWYMQILALKQEFELPERAAALQDDAGFTLFLEQASTDGINPCCVLYFQVENVEEMYRRLIEAQQKFVHPPQKQFWGYGAELLDPDGYRLRLWDEETMKDKSSP